MKVIGVCPGGCLSTVQHSLVQRSVCTPVTQQFHSRVYLPSSPGSEETYMRVSMAALFVAGESWKLSGRPSLQKYRGETLGRASMGSAAADGSHGSMYTC